MRELKFICEEWKDVPKFNGYEVSNFGRVRGKDRYRKGRIGVCFLKGKELKQVPNKKGYPEVRFRKEGNHTRLVHRLVAIAFIPNPENLPQVNHKDGVKSNNHYTNLEWNNNSRNQLHAYKLGLQPSRAGENNTNAKIKDKDVDNLKFLYNSGLTPLEVSNFTGVKLYTIRQIIYGSTWKSNNTIIIKRDDRKREIIKPTI